MVKRTRITKKAPKKRKGQYKIVKRDIIDLSQYARRSIIGMLRTKLLSKQTKAEKELYKHLNKNTINYIKQYPIDCNGKIYFADAYLTYYNLIVECDGGYHYQERIIKKDIQRDSHIRSCGYQIIHFMNEEIISTAYMAILKQYGVCLNP